MTDEGKKFIDYFIKGKCTLDTLQIVYNKGHITKAEFKEVTGIEPQEKPVDNTLALEERVIALEEMIIMLSE